MSADPTTESKPVLEPLERISEVLFGLIIVLTFTCTLSVRSAGRGEVGKMVMEALGCSVAWGIIDAAFYLVGSLSERGHNLLLWRKLREAKQAGDGRRTIREALPPAIGVRISEEELESLRRALANAPEPALRVHPTKDDWRGSLGVFLLATLSTLPVLVPFLFMRDAAKAVRVSNGIAIVLLFVAGWALGRYSSPHPWRVALAMVVLGVLLVAVAIALGG